MPGELYILVFCFGLYRRFTSIYFSFSFSPFLTIFRNHSLDMQRVLRAFSIRIFVFVFDYVYTYLSFFSVSRKHVVIALSNDVAVCKSMRFHCLYNLNVKFSLRLSSFSIFMCCCRCFFSHIVYSCCYYWRIR